VLLSPIPHPIITIPTLKIQNSDKDPFWGCGADGKGKNELGRALVRLRAKLRG